MNKNENRNGIVRVIVMPIASFSFLGINANKKNANNEKNETIEKNLLTSMGILVE
jgi:hypothetical protein